MRRMILVLKIVLVVASFIVTISGFTETKDNLRGFERRIEQIRSFENRIRESQDVMKTAQTILTDFGDIREDGYGVEFFRYYQARMAILAEKKQDARDVLIELVKNRVIAPLALHALYEIDAAYTSPEERSKYYLLLGRLLPVGGYGSLLDSVSLNYSSTSTPLAILAESRQKRQRIIAQAG